MNTLDAAHYDEDYFWLVKGCPGNTHAEQLSYRRGVEATRVPRGDLINARARAGAAWAEAVAKGPKGAGAERIATALRTYEAAQLAERAG